MIYLLELPDNGAAHAWFAFDGEDLRTKLAARGGPPDCALKIWPDEASALHAFENESDPLWQGSGWRARRALYQQLLATEVLAED